MTSDPDLRTLERFVGDIDEFASRYWALKPLLRRTGEDFSDLITVERIERLLVQAGRAPTFRLVRDGKPLEPRRYTTTARLGGRAVDDVADVERIAAEVADGATLVMQGLQRTDLRIAQLCRSLERAISHPVQANAYLSPSGTTGLAAHTDDHDVLVVQVTGTKLWEIENLGSIATGPGDVVYLPAGERHAAATQATPSLHLTVGIVRVTHRDVLRRMLDDIDGLGAPLPLGYARPEGTDALVRSLTSAMAAAAAAGTRDLRPVADREQRRAQRRRSPLGTGVLQSVLSLHSLTADSVLTGRPDQPVTVLQRDDGAVVLELNDRRIRFPAAMGPALDQALTGKSLKVRDLRELSPESRLVLARRLAREGIITVGPSPG